MSQAHYPESMGLTLIINAPWLFHGVWKFIRPFIDKTSVQKIKILSSRGDALRLEMTQYIADSELPPFITGRPAIEGHDTGGISMFQPIHGPWTDLDYVRPELKTVFPRLQYADGSTD